MRLTLLHPDPAQGTGSYATDVDVELGVPLAALRPAFAHLSGRAGWASTAHRVAVADQVLDEDHPTGQAPLVQGCVLRLGPGAPGEAEQALRQPWHVAVVAGPDCGGLTGLPDRSRTVVGPGLVVRRRGDRVRVRAGSRTRFRRWRPGTARTVGTTTYTLRPRTPDTPNAGHDASGHDASGHDAAGHARVPVATWLAPAIGSVALAAALRQPLLALVGLVGPLGALISTRRRRRPRPRPCLDTDPAALVAATVRAGAEQVEVDLPWDAGGALAVVGPRTLAMPVARAAVLAALGTHLAPVLVVRTRAPEDWSWCVWATTSDAPYPTAADERAVVVVDDPPDPAELARWRAAAPAGHRLLILASSAAAVPAWCRSRLEVGRAVVRVRRPDGSCATVARHAVSAETALAQVRRASALRSRADATGPPGRVSLGALEGIPAPDADAVAAAWDRPRAGLRAALGRGRDRRTVTVDLGTDGPHALVAGTTGAGKSELLTTLVLALALTHPPERLAVLLVDFKGGTGLGAVAGLPHVLEHVTDLDAPHAHRVLTGLRAELRRRERLLSAAGARDLRELDPRSADTPPRLLVVVDELRALTEDVPDAAAALARLAAQGRALGVHLVLATQRPAGAVGADLRANVSLRIALRVTDAADSTDVLDAPDAARLDPATPGRALLRRGAGPLEPLQVARAVADAGGSPVRRAAPWAAERAPGWSPERAHAVDSDAVAEWVAAARLAARYRAGPRTPWLPALPAVVRAQDVADGPGLAVGVADLPDEQRRGAVRWDAVDGHLLVLGGPRSGRTTALVTVGLAALARGWHVHTVGLPDAAVARLRAGDPHGSLGSVLGAADACSTARLLELLERRTGPVPPDGPGAVLLVDQLATVLGALDGLARGAGADRLTALWRGPGGRVAVAAAADVGGPATSHAGAFRDRLILPLTDPVLDSLAGVPGAFTGPRVLPGRAVHLHAGGAQLVQVALPGPPPTHRGAAPGARVGGVRAGGARVGGPPDGSAPVRLRTLPERAPLPTEARARESGGRVHVPLGSGGDHATRVDVDIGPGFLAAGPPGSGRSTALAVVALGLARAGHAVVRLIDLGSAPAPLGGVLDVAVDEALAGGGLDLDRLIADRPFVRPLAGRLVLVIDDLDELERIRPEVTDLVATLLSAPGGARVVASSNASAAAGAFRGALPALLRTRRVLVLDPLDPAAAELAGPRAVWFADPRRRTAGRGVLVHGREVTPLQVYGAPNG